MICSRCGNGMHFDARGAVWSCMICGNMVIDTDPSEANAFCRCGRKFVKRGRAEQCGRCRALAKMKTPPPIQKCKSCGREYRPKRRGTKYCSKNCASRQSARDVYRRKRQVRYCQLCGDPIEGSGSKFCSAECRHENWKANNAERLKTAARNYYEKNKEEHNARSLKRYYENRELRLRQGRRWDKQNPEKRREIARRYKERKALHG